MNTRLTMLSFFSSLCFIVLFSVTTYGQSPPLHAEIGINFQLGFPQNEFGDNISNTGYGFGIDALWMPKEFGVGLSVNYLVLGSETRTEPFSTTIPDVQVEVNTTNSILLGHILMRAQYPKGMIRPYIDGLVGLHAFTTTTEIEDLGGFEETVASSTNQDDYTFSYGGGAGIMVRVHQDSEEKIEAIMIDVGVRYILGGEAKYLKEGSIRRVDGNVEFDELNSKTDIITGHIGVVLRF
jgi:hypothetical protein